MGGTSKLETGKIKLRYSKPLENSKKSMVEGAGRRKERKNNIIILTTMNF